MILKTLLVSLVSAQKYDPHFSISQPLQNSTFNYWKSRGTSVFLNDKVVLTPEKPNMAGLIYAKNSFTLEDFRLDVDVTITNTEHSSMARGDMYFYILRDNPMKNAYDYATGLDGMFDGVRVHIQQGVNKNKDKSKGSPPRVHRIMAKVQDENFLDLFRNAHEQYCETSEEHFSIYMEHKDHLLRIGIITEDGKKDQCFAGKFDSVGGYFVEDHESFIFLAANTQNYFANGQYITEARFKDIKHLHDQVSQSEENSNRKFFKNTQKQKDLFRKGAMKTDFTIESYNQQLIKHNQLYSTLVSEFITNSETIVQHLNSLPHHEVASDLAKQAATVNQRFQLLNTQFDNYDADMKKYNRYLENMMNEREDMRDQGDSDSKANQEQRQIMDSLQKISGFIDTYKASLDDNHIIKEITDYDAVIKNFDKQYVDRDNKIITQHAQNTGHDDFLTDDELQLLFSQQVRKIMSKNVKTMEKDIKKNVKKGQMGEASAIIDYIMYISIVFVFIFGWTSYKKLKDQGDSLVI